ncbi:CCA tRNA nucleotidyltransferase [Candidatus Woesearchaeota archaeon]|nr:CCA tRNA nucleotidyltransferase [Candidatus Woesearchaeota archaeon]
MAGNTMDAVFRESLKAIKPEEQEFTEADETIKHINSLLRQKGIKAECMAGGSYAKGTILKDDFDIDLFVRFDYSYKDKGISEMLGKALEPLHPELVHGSRDYFQVRKDYQMKKIKGKAKSSGKGSLQDSLLFEIIPVLMIDDYKQAVNVTDMSPLHVSYAKKKFAEKPGLADEIRLAKQFCKSIGVYGAESYIRGFSGHVLDLLVIYYGSFEALLLQAAVWGSRVIIDLENHLAEPLKQLNKAKTESPLIIVDPVQPDRNAAASISKEKFELFKSKAKEFLESPSINFFKIKKLSIGELKKKAGKEILLLLKVKPLEGNKDIVGTKVMKAFEHIEKQLKKHEFKVLEAGWEFGVEQSIIYYILKKEKMKSTVVMIGPPAREKKDAKRFKAKHPRVFEDNGRLYAEEKRQYMTPEELVKDLIRDNYVKERVRQVSICK